MKCKVTTFPALEYALSDLVDENGEVDTEDLYDRLDDLGISMYPTSISFGDLDYSSNEECTIELKQKYYKNSCEDIKDVATTSDTILCNEDSQQQMNPVGIYGILDTLSWKQQTLKTNATEVTER